MSSSDDSGPIDETVDALCPECGEHMVVCKDSGNWYECGDCGHPWGTLHEYVESILIAFREHVREALLKY